VPAHLRRHRAQTPANARGANAYGRFHGAFRQLAYVWIFCCVTHQDASGFDFLFFLRRKKETKKDLIRFSRSFVWFASSLNLFLTRYGAKIQTRGIYRHFSRAGK